MGNRRRVLRPNRKKGVAMVDTDMAINGCKVFVGHPDPVRATRAARQFAESLPVVMARAKIPNMQDFYRSHFAACEQMLEPST